MFAEDSRRTEVEAGIFESFWTGEETGYIVKFIRKHGFI